MNKEINMHLETPDTTKYEALLRLWNSAHIRLSDMQHRLLLRQSVQMTSENSSFLFVRCKECSAQLGSLAIKLKGSALFHVGRGQTLSIPAAKDEVELYQASYQAQLPQSAGIALNSLLALGGPLDYTLYISPMKTANFERHFRTMQDAYANPSPQNALLLKSHLYLVAEGFFREISLESPVSIDVFEQARQYLAQHFREQVSIQDLAASLGVSRSHLYKLFKEAVDQSPKEYLMRRRLKSASIELLQGDESLDQIAANCGLTDKAYFSRIFKRYYQISPGAYRDLHAGKKKDFPLLHLEPKKRDRRLSIENFGRLHTFNNPPKRVVCLNYATAEICLALGVEKALIGVADADEALKDCHPEYRELMKNIPFLYSRSGKHNVPALVDILACRPDFVIGTSYSFEAVSGVADADAFERQGIHIYAMTATCKLNSTLKDTYLDIWNLAQIFGKEERGKTLIEQMRSDVAALQKSFIEISNPVRVFSITGTVEGKPYSSGQSYENHLINLAGGNNIFGHHRRQFSVMDWESVAQENPEVILVHRLSNKTDEQCLALIQNVPCLQYADAVKNKRIHVIGLKKVFPGIDNVKTAWTLASLFHPDII